MGLYFEHTIFYGHLIWSTTPPNTQNIPEGLKIVNVGHHYYAICVSDRHKVLGELQVGTLYRGAPEYEAFMKEYEGWLDTSYDESLENVLSRLSIERRRPGSPGLILFESCCCTLSDPSGMSYRYIDLRI